MKSKSPPSTLIYNDDDVHGGGGWSHGVTAGGQVQVLTRSGHA